MKNILIVLTALLGLFIFNCLIGWAILVLLHLFLPFVITFKLVIAVGIIIFLIQLLVGGH